MEDYIVKETRTDSDGKLQNTQINHADDFISKPLLSENCRLPVDVLQLHHSFGYDCRLHFNLQVADDETLLFVSGNLIHIFNVRTKEMNFRRSAGGGGFGHVLMNKNEKYKNCIAVAEKGIAPLIVIYQWPDWNVISVLKHGALREYTHLDFNPDGTLLASQAGSPDLLLTIWDWRKGCIILSVKSCTEQVYNVKFSRYVPGELATCGVKHVKFWKMIRTFTGLKIIGKLGRFGQTDVSDILGVYPMPNNYTLTGCSWGNMLLWEDDEIKLEVTRKGRKPCHSGEIVQFRYYHDLRELTSISVGDFLKVWNFGAVESFYPSEDEKYIEMKPIYEILVKDKLSVAHFYSMAKSSGEDDCKRQNWFGQDLNGGIWDVDMAVARNVRDPKKLYWCHSKSITDIAASPHGYYVASIGEDGRLHLYDVKTKKIIIIKQFNAPGFCLLWLPLEVAKSGSIIVAGFGDGSIKVLIARIQHQINCQEEDNFDWITVIQMSKPHTNIVTKLTLSLNGNYLLSGSMDSTIFIYKMLKDDQVDVTLEPVGFVPIPEAVTCLDVNPVKENLILVGCEKGKLLEVQFSDTKLSDAGDSYKLECHITCLTEDFDNIIENEGNCNESKIVHAFYTKFGSILFSLNSPGVCCIYEYRKDSAQSFRMAKVPGVEDARLSCFLLSCEEDFLFLGFDNGGVRVTQTSPGKTDFTEYWEIPMHDSFNGVIPKLCLSHDQRFLFSCGTDGNLFVFKLNLNEEFFLKFKPLPPKCIEPIFAAMDEFEDLIFSLEEKRKNTKQDQILESINRKKINIRNILSNLKAQFVSLCRRNAKIPSSQIMPRSLFQLDRRIDEYIRSKIGDETSFLNKKMAYKIEKSQLGLKKVCEYFTDPIQHHLIHIFAIRKLQMVVTFTLKKLGTNFEFLHAELLRRRGDEILVQRRRNQDFDDILEKDKASLELEMNVDFQPKITAVESFLKDMEQLQVKLPLKTQRLLERYLNKKAVNELKERKWQELMRKQPNGSTAIDSNLSSLQNARDTIGDYKLKTSEDCKVTDQFCVSVLQQLLLLVECKLKIFNKKNTFNQTLLNLRTEKSALLVVWNSLHEESIKLALELPPDLIKILPPVPEVDQTMEFPETALMDDESPFLDVNSKTRFFDEEFEILYPKKYVHRAINCSKTPILWQSEVSEKSLIKHIVEDHSDSEHEIEVKHKRLKRNLKRQSQIKRIIEDRITHFDEKVKLLAEQRIELAMVIVFEELHLLTLHQELIIVRKYEKRESELLEAVMKSVEEKNSELIQIEEIRIKIKNQYERLKLLQENLNSVVQLFYEATEHSSHKEFLKKTFWNKRGSRKLSNEGGKLQESLSFISPESSESETDGDFQGLTRTKYFKINSTDYPLGCECELYQLAQTSRLKRIEIRKAIKKKNDEIEAIKKLLHDREEKMKSTDSVLHGSNHKLNNLRHRKQKELNEVKTVAVITLSQMCHFRPNLSLEKFENTIAFSVLELEKLNVRLSELKEETKAINIDGRKKQTHLHRLKLDCKKMMDEITELKGKISKAISIKFGQPLDVDSLEELILKRLMGDIKSSLPDIKNELNKESAQRKECLQEKEENLITVIKENTEKSDLLATLQEELQNMRDLIKKQDSLKNCRSVEVGEEWGKDIAKLTKIERHLRLKQEILLSEIRGLSFKGRPLPPILSPPPPKVGDPDDSLLKNMVVSSFPLSESSEHKSKQVENILPRGDEQENTKEWVLGKVQSIVALLDDPSSFKDVVIRQLLCDLIVATEGNKNYGEFILLSKETLGTVLEIIKVDIAPKGPSRSSMEKNLRETFQFLSRKESKISKVASVSDSTTNVDIFEKEVEIISMRLVKDTIMKVTEES